MVQTLSKEIVSAGADDSGATTMEDNEVNNRCYLLKLPRELRDMIIEEATENKNIAYLCFKSHYQVDHPELAAVNRQLREETLSMFYGSKIFWIGSLVRTGQLDFAKRWFYAIQPHLHLIKAVYFELCNKHKRILRIDAAPGKKPSWGYGDLVEERLRYVDDSESPGLTQKEREVALYFAEKARGKCNFDKIAKQANPGLFAICDSVGLDGFGAEQYIRAVEMCWFWDEERCREDRTWNLVDCDDDSDFE